MAVTAVSTPRSMCCDAHKLFHSPALLWSMQQGSCTFLHVHFLLHLFASKSKRVKKESKYCECIVIFCQLTTLYQHELLLLQKLICIIFSDVCIFSIAILRTIQVAIYTDSNWITLMFWCLKTNYSLETLWHLTQIYVWKSIFFLMI